MYNFDDIIGQNLIISHMQQAIQSGKVSHAYILEGEIGMGKKLLAGAFAKALQCEKQGIDPCDSCESCLNYNHNNHPDIAYVIASNKTGYGVNDIREQVNGTIHTKPYNSKYKIYIIDQADTLTTQGQNALLKTIEEPPSYGIIILLVENSQNLLTTILSRCVKIMVSPVPKAQIFDYLKKREGISDYDANIYASFSRGNIGKALQLLEDESFKEIREFLIEIFEMIINKDTYNLLNAAKKMESYKGQINTVFDIMLSWLRDLMVLKTTKAEKYLIHLDKYKTLLKQSGHMSYNRISVLIERIEETKSNFRLHANFQLSFETLLLI